MTNWNGLNCTKPGTWLKGVARLGALLSVLAMVALIPGCPPRPIPCTTDADCDDGDGCTTDTCGDDGNCLDSAADCEADHCVNDVCAECLVATECDDNDECTDDACTNGACENTPVDCDDSNACTTDACDPATGDCTNTAIDCDDSSECTDDSCDPATGCVNAVVDCDDGDLCTDDSCDSATGCVNADVECPVGQVCVNGVCITECDTDADCFDDDLCTDDVCDEGACSNPATCNDGVACTDDLCDPDTGACTNPSNCDAGEVCNPDTDVCEPGEPCDSDADCPDNGIFCDGSESCGPDDFCVSSGNPCDLDGGQTCNEDLNQCENPEGETLNFTLGVDNLSGTGGDDTFKALVAFNAPTGTNLPTLQNSDTANGGDSDDTLNAQLDSGGANVTLAPTLTSIETWNVTDFGTAGNGFATTLSAINSTGIGAINSLSSIDDAVTITNVNTLVNLGVTNSTSDLLVTLIAPAGSGNADATTLTLSGSRAGSTVTLTTPANGVETANVVSSGAAANILDAFTQATGTTLTTLNVSGSQNLTITGALNTTLATVSASGMTGNTNLNLSGNGLNVIFTGGTGNDTVNFAAGYSAADTINGGTGANTLAMFSAQAVAATTQQTNVSNVQTIQISDSLSGAVDVTKFGPTSTTGALDGALDTTAAATALTAGASTMTLGTGNRTFIMNNDDTAHTVNVVVSGAGTTDVLTVNAQNADLGAVLTATGAETVSYVSGNGSDGTAADGNVNTATGLTITPTFGASTLNISGSVAVTTTGAMNAAVINASSLTAALTMGLESTSAGGATITGTAFNDTLFGTGSATGDGISGGDGNDKMVGRVGGDNLIGGNGSDTHQYQQTTDGGAANADNVGMDLINGLTIGAGGDILAFQDDIFFTNGHTLDLDIITGAAAGNVVTGLTDGGAATAQVIVQTTPLTNFAAVATLFTTIDGAITTTKAVVIAEVTGVGTFVFFDANTAVADGEQVLGQLVGVTGANLAAIVAANLAINDG